jgi:homoserine O-acetyltransferase
VTYLSSYSMAEKFGRKLRGEGALSYTVTEPDFEVESYLRHQGEKFVRRFDANTYLYMSRALSYFDLARQYGGGSLERAVADFQAATLLICFSSDWLYPPSNSRALAEALEASGKEVELHVVEAPYGHDSFLLEEARQTPMIRDFLSRVYRDRRGARRF